MTGLGSGETLIPKPIRSLSATLYAAVTAGRARELNSADGRGCARKRAIASEHGAEGGEAVGGWWSNEARLRHGRATVESLRYSDRPTPSRIVASARSELCIGTPDRDRCRNRTAIRRVDRTRTHRGLDTTPLRATPTTGFGATRHDAPRFAHGDTTDSPPPQTGPDPHAASKKGGLGSRYSSSWNRARTVARETSAASASSP